VSLARYEWLACVLGAGLIASHVAIKPGPDLRETRRYRESSARERDWLSRVAPPFEASLRDGSRFRLTESIGRSVVVLIFFTTWCASCPGDLVELDQYAVALQRAGRPFEVLAIDAQEEPDVVDRLVRELGVTIPMALDDSGEILRAYTINSFPTTVVIGADGRVSLYRASAIVNARVTLDPIVLREFETLARLERLSRP
jgi:peroxiredoxin